MKIFCDTNVLVAAMEASHPHNSRALPIFKSIEGGSDVGLASSHSIAECYASLTRLPIRPRLHPQDAKRMIETTILGHFDLVETTAQDYLEALALTANLGLPGPKIYDALIVCTAVRSGAERIYTFNTSDFAMFASVGSGSLVCAP